MDRGHAFLLTAERTGDPAAKAGLTLTLSPQPAAASDPVTDLPLPVRHHPDGSCSWHLGLPDSPGPEGAVARTPRDGTEAAEEEVREVLRRLDALGSEHRRLTDELAETNSGVVALYVELEERDEQLRRAHGRILQELEDALRPAPPAVPGLELAVHYVPADVHAPTGGDLYDWFVLPDGSVHVTVVDALGHGVRSTRSALDVTHAVRTLALEGHPPKTLVERAGEIVSAMDAQAMATVLIVRIDPAGGEVLLANGSHPPALVVRSDGAADFLEVRGRGIGFPMPGSESVLRTHLGEGDLLVLYTDGLTESRRDPLEGERRLAASARRHSGRPIREVPGAIAEDMRSVVLHADDTLALTLRRPG
ncbi:PP2C family protein-serine/threonine phosphatase [Streptomyces sp. TR06-5]|uniref:PP2C family protein-serine/threonine phosphatase n=1 Tax=unclassified Streptomyces TaxID=2593676 RepID=UPI00399F2265